MLGHLNKDAPHFYRTGAGVARVSARTPPRTETGWSRVEQTKITQRQQAINRAWRPPATKTGYQHGPEGTTATQQSARLVRVKPCEGCWEMCTGCDRLQTFAWCGVRTKAWREGRETRRARPHFGMFCEEVEPMMKHGASFSSGSLKPSWI